MNYVYAIVCHKLTNPLIFTVKELLSSTKSKVILHVDRKTPHTELIKIQKALGRHPNLHYVSDKDRIDVRWGAVSQIHVMLLLLKLAKVYDYYYFSLISGDDIPLSLNQSREQYLQSAYESKIEFIGYNSVHDANERLKINYPAFFHKKDHSLVGKLARKIFKIYAKYFRTIDISHLPKLYKGSTWFTLTNEAVDYILDYIENNPRYLESFKFSLCGDEVFFQTIIFNSKFSSKVYKIRSEILDCERGGRYIDWVSGPDYPRTLDATDFERMRASDSLFARKLDPEISLDILAEFLYLD
jgi:hypothetical protein